MKRLQENVAVITGAATGIGRALALRLAQEGAQLCLVDINKDLLAEAAAALKQKGATVSTYVVDVADSAQVEALAGNVVRDHGRVEMLINNAGVALFGNVEELSLSDIEWIMAINFWGVVYGVKHFLPILKQQKKAYLVNLSSIFGMIAPPGHAAYCASKFAVRGFTEALKHELKGTSVQVSAIHPGGIQTGIAKAARIGAGSDARKCAEETEKFERLFITTPERAADRIVRGVLKGETRILIGSDALQIDWFQRLLPARYWRVLGPLLELKMRR